MLASITPLGERGRGQRWWLTVTAHVVGSVLGGAAIGAAMGLIGMAIEGLGGAYRSDRPRRGRGARRAARGLGVEPSAPSLTPSPGQRGLARLVPRLGLRRRFRFPAGTRRHHDHHLGSGPRHAGGRRPHRQSRARQRSSAGSSGWPGGSRCSPWPASDQPTTLLDRHRHMQELYPAARKAAVAAQAGVLVAVVAGA